MNIVGYIVQYFNEEQLMPETGYKHLYKSFNQALESAKARVQEYLVQHDEMLAEPLEIHTPTKKQTDSDGYSIVFRNVEIQIWIEVIVQ